MDAYCALIPHPLVGTLICCPAGSDRAPIEKPVQINATPFRPGASSSAFSIMVSLLETLRNLVLSGHEPASFLIAVQPDGRPVLVAGASAAELPRVRYDYGAVSLAFVVSARRTPAGLLLQVSEPTGHTGYVLDQLCRRTAGGFYEALPHCWREVSSSRPTLDRASSAYQSTSGLIPYWGSRNSSLLNQRIC